MNTAPSSRPPIPPNARRLGRAPKFGVFLLIAAALAFAVAHFSNDRSYDERMLDLVAKQALSRDTYDQVKDSPALEALLLDVDHDMDLSFKMRLALSKYPDDAKDVLIRFGDEPELQSSLRRYGENIVPVIALFVKTDMKSVLVIYRAKKTWAETFGYLRGKLSKEPEIQPVAQDHGPQLRGMYALERVASEGHQFLGQFDLDDKKQAHWNNTERALTGLKSLLGSGMIDLERKKNEGKQIDIEDCVWAGADVFGIVGAAKAIKYLKYLNSGGKTAKRIGIAERAQIMGGQVLRKDRFGASVIKYGAKVATAYVIARHPGLLNGVFVAIGKLLGIPPWAAKTLGWTLVFGLLYVVLAPLRFALRSLIAFLNGITRLLSWLTSGAGKRPGSAQTA